MDILKRKAGRPRKAANQKVVKMAVSICYKNHEYILKILEERKMQKKGHFSRVLNEIIEDHLKVKRFKEKEASKAQAVIDDLGI